MAPGPAATGGYLPFDGSSGHRMACPSSCVGWATVGGARAVTDLYPTSGGCTPDSGAIYQDRSGYTACITDAQLNAEVLTFLTAHSLPNDLAHLYAISYYPAQNANHGWRSISVKLVGKNLQKYHIRTRAGYRVLQTAQASQPVLEEAAVK